MAVISVKTMADTFCNSAERPHPTQIVGRVLLEKSPAGEGVTERLGLRLTETVALDSHVRACGVWECALGIGYRTV